MSEIRDVNFNEPDVLCDCCWDNLGETILHTATCTNHRRCVERMCAEAEEDYEVACRNQRLDHQSDDDRHFTDIKTPL